MSDPVNHPAHYQRADGMEAIELCELLPFNEGNAIKYLWRAGRKGSAVEDLRKALWYAKRAHSGSWWWPKRAAHSEMVDRAYAGFDSALVADAIRHLAHGDAESAIPSIETLIDVAALETAREREEAA